MRAGKLDCHALSDAGRRRSINEDHFLIADLVKAVRIQLTSLSYDEHAEVTGHSLGKILLVADGMGAHEAGKRAATLAVDETISYMVNRMHWHNFQKVSSSKSDSDLLAEDLIAAFQYCQGRIQNEANLNPLRQGMCTTLTVAIVDWPTLHLVHAGGSRCYLYRDQKIRQLTRDHTRAQLLVDSGARRDLSAKQLGGRNALWNVVGGDSAELEPEFFTMDLTAGDSLLLCSDGLTAHLCDESIAGTLSAAQTAHGACEKLVAEANADGGSDNITVIVARFHDLKESLRLETAEAGSDLLGDSTSGASEDEASADARRGKLKPDMPVALDG